MADQGDEAGKAEETGDTTSSSKVDLGALEAAHDAISAEVNAPAAKETAADDPQTTSTSDPPETTGPPKEPLTEAEIQAKMDDAYRRGQNATSSGLGRQLKTMEDRFNSKLNELSQSQNPAEESEDDDEEIVLTKKELKSYTKNIARETAQEDLAAAQKTETIYHDSYVKKTGELGAGYNETPATRDGIYKLFLDEFSFRHSKDGEKDAELNFAKAEAAFFKKQMKVKINPLKGNNPITPLDSGVGTKVIKKNAQVIQLKTPEAIEFANQYNMSEESKQRALSR